MRVHGWSKWVMLGAVASLAAGSASAAVRQVWSFKEWEDLARSWTEMANFTSLDLQRVGVARVANFYVGTTAQGKMGNPDAPYGGGASLAIRQTPVQFWMDPDYRPKYGIGTSVEDADYAADNPAPVFLRLYGAGDRFLGEVSLLVPPANQWNEKDAGAQFLGAVASERVLYWEIQGGSSNQLAADEILLGDFPPEVRPSAVPEPSVLALALVAAALASRRVRYGRSRS